MERAMGNISATAAACAIKLDKNTAPTNTAARATKGFDPPIEASKWAIFSASPAWTWLPQ